jgi:hypothetical protein
LCRSVGRICVRDLDTAVLRNKSLVPVGGRQLTGQSEQSIRACIRTTVVKVLKLETGEASLEERKLLISSGVLQKNAPSAMLLKSSDASKLLAGQFLFFWVVTTQCGSNGAEFGHGNVAKQLRGLGHSPNVSNLLTQQKKKTGGIRKKRSLTHKKKSPARKKIRIDAPAPLPPRNPGGAAMLMKRSKPKRTVLRITKLVK